MTVQGTGTPLFFVPIDSDFTMRKIAATCMILNSFFSFLNFLFFCIDGKRTVLCKWEGWSWCHTCSLCCLTRYIWKNWRCLFSSITFQELVDSKFKINPFTPRSDQGWISPHNIHTISSRKVTRSRNVVN